VYNGGSRGGQREPYTLRGDGVNGPPTTAQSLRPILFQADVPTRRRAAARRGEVALMIINIGFQPLASTRRRWRAGLGRGCRPDPPTRWPVQRVARRARDMTRTTYACHDLRVMRIDRHLLGHFVTKNLPLPVVVMAVLPISSDPP